MSENRKPVGPVRPVRMEFICIYPCPHCAREVPLLAPTSPAMARCDACSRNFPVIPVDQKCLKFMRVMTANGRAAVDPDFV